jgi:hypothetical protein
MLLTVEHYGNASVRGAEHDRGSEQHGLVDVRSHNPYLTGKGSP